MADGTIGVYASASRQAVRVLNGDGTVGTSGDWVQVSRLGSARRRGGHPNPARRTGGTPPIRPTTRSSWAATSPSLAGLVNLLYPGLPGHADRGAQRSSWPCSSPACPGSTTGDTKADLLRLNTASRRRRSRTLGALAGDLQGFPNGRRLADDVTDIEIRAVACGYGQILAGALGLCNFTPNDTLADGVDKNRGNFLSTFPYVAPPKPGLRAHGPPVGEEAREWGTGRHSWWLARLPSRSLWEAWSAASSPSVRPPRRPRLPGGARRAGALGAAGSIGAATVSGLEEQVSAHPEDAELLTRLGFAYQLRWRETADARSCRARRPRCDAPSGSAATTGRRSSASACSRSSGTTSARRWHTDGARSGCCRARRGRSASSATLWSSSAYGEAFRAFERMVELRPGLASYARVAYARELTGDRTGALVAMRLALDAAARQPEPTPRGARRAVSWGREGRPGRSRCARRARGLPGYPPPDRAGADREARGASGAHRRARREAIPTSQAVSLRRPPRSGRAAEPSREDSAPRWRSSTASCRRTACRSTSSPPSTAPTVGTHRARRSRLARRARADRPSIYGDDALAWSLARAGRREERCRSPTTRSASARRTRSCSSIAGSSRAVRETGTE